MNLFILLSTLWVLMACDNASYTTETPMRIEADTMVRQVHYDTLNVDPQVAVKENCFIVIVKQECHLYVCEDCEGDTVCRAHYPVCIGLNKGQKQKEGDMRTPESSFENPFFITQITSQWMHKSSNYGKIMAYDNGILRLATPGFSGIGIHGSTNTQSPVPGRGTEGCIRLRDHDLGQLKEKYAYVGMKVVILPDETITN